MLVIAPNYLHKDIRNYYRKDNPLFDIKLISKNDLKSAVYPNVKNRAIIHLMDKHQLTYDIAEMYLEYIPYAKAGISRKLDNLVKLKEDLKKENLLFDNEPVRLLYFNKEAKVIGYCKDDQELNYLLKELNINPTYSSLEVDYQVSEINQFNRIEDEVYFVLNEIAHLLDTGVDINDIVIVRKYSGYDYYLKKFASSFGYQINLDNSTSWSDSGLYVEFMRLYESNLDIEESLIELKEICREDDLYDEFVIAVRSLILEDVSEEIQYEYLTHRIKQLSYNLGRFDNAVNVSNNFPYVENKHVFVLGFMQSLFPKTNKDSGYLNNEELKQLYLLNAKEETRFDQEFILNSLKLPNFYSLSYSLTLSLGKYGYISPIATKLGLKKNINPFKDYFYSRPVLSYIVCDLEDSNYYYDERNEKYYKTLNVIDIPYNKYDNQYTFTNVYSSLDVIRLSTTSLTSYYGCPFRYYLSDILKVDPFEETEYTVLGNVVHRILEESLLDDKYDVEAKFKQYVAESSVDGDIKVLWSINILEQVKLAVMAVRLHKNYMKNPVFYHEIKLDYKLNENTTVTGRIDKLILLDKKYAVAVDYKTGSSGDFVSDQLKYGISSQLPSYAYLIGHSKFEDYQVTGLYIHHVLFNNKIEKDEDELIAKELKLAGKSLNNFDAFVSLDNTIGDGTSSFVKNVSYKDTGLNSGKGSGLVSETEMEEFVNKVEELLVNASKRIHNNDFVIKPLFIKNYSACDHCSFKDICYVKYSQKYFPEGEEVEENE